MARKKRKNRSADDPASTAPAATDSTESAEGARRFRSYFELLEEKYADDPPPRVVVPESERAADAEPVPDRRHAPRPTRKPKPITAEPSASPIPETAETEDSHAVGDDPDGVRSVTGVISVEPDPPTPRIRQTQAIAIDRNMRWVVVLAFLAGVVATALIVFFLAEGDDEDDALVPPAGPPLAVAEPVERPAPAAPFGSVTEIASESPIPEPAIEPPVERPAPSPAADPPAQTVDMSPESEPGPDEEPVSPGEPDEGAPSREPPAAAPPASVEEPPSATESPSEDVSAASESPAPDPVTPAYAPARKAFAPQPGYPAAARELGEEGTVVLVGTVTVDGDVTAARVVESAGPRLDRASLETFRTWQFQPAVRDGEPVESPYRVSFRFALDRRAPSSAAVAPPPPEATAPPPPEAPAPPPEAPAATGTVDDPLPIGGEFETPQRRVTPLPSLPRGRAGDVGDLVLSVVVDREGRVARVVVEQAVDPEVTARAVEAVRRWRFQPATRDGEPVAVWHRLVLRL